MHLHFFLYIFPKFYVFLFLCAGWRCVVKNNAVLLLLTVEKHLKMTVRHGKVLMELSVLRASRAAGTGRTEAAAAAAAAAAAKLELAG